MAKTTPAYKDSSTAEWHSLEISQILTLLGDFPNGLSAQEANERLAKYGANFLRPVKPRSTLHRFLVQFHNVLIYVLLVAGLATAILGHWVDSGVIFGVVFVNGIIGFIQEGKAERALEAVRNLLSPQASVLRDGHRQSIPADQLVPGDIVFLQSGDRVPADLRLTKLKELRIDEAMLTGESLPVDKDTSPIKADAPLGDRRCMAYSGTLVTFGQGTGLVVSTAENTEIGRITKMLAQVQMLTTPLLRQIASFAKWLTGAVLVLALATFVFGVSVYQFTATEMMLASVGLAVAAIPEGLPAIITITLAVGVQRMAKRNAIIRRLPAVETLGSVTSICSDKTGTLTRNEMAVKSVIVADHSYDVTGTGYDPHGGIQLNEQEITLNEHPALLELCKAAILCNDATIRNEHARWIVHGDPTEAALVTLGMKAGLMTALLHEEYPRTDVIPFESEHRFMATLHHDHQGHGFVYIKGAPEIILQRCNHERMLGDDQPINLDYWNRCLDDVAGLGQRTLALAFKSHPKGQTELCFDDVDGGLTLLGITGLMDPPREEAIQSVRRCQDAGICVKMITGDHARTAIAVASQLNIGDGKTAVSGEQLAHLDDRAVQDAVLNVDVFARTSPEHKLRLVTALQAQGQVVAMTGDGVNDAPALKRADVGVAMGIKGTEAAKEAAEMVLADDNFASIGHAVEEGRTVFDNIKKSILFILPTNGGEAITIVAAILLGKMLPVTAAQILWVNMITAVTLALALAFEPAESNVMKRTPRNPKEPILSGFMTWRVLFVSILMVLATFGLFLYERSQGASIELARTVAVNTLVILEIFYLLTTRYIIESVFSREGFFGNQYVLIAIALVLVFQMLFTYAPFMQLFFTTTDLNIDAWLRIFTAGLLLMLLVEFEKWIFRLFYRERH